MSLSCQNQSGRGGGGDRGADPGTAGVRFPKKEPRSEANNAPNRLRREKSWLMGGLFLAPREGRKSSESDHANGFGPCQLAFRCKPFISIALRRLSPIIPIIRLLSTGDGRYPEETVCPDSGEDCLLVPDLCLGLRLGRSGKRVRKPSQGVRGAQRGAILMSA